MDDVYYRLYLRECPYQLTEKVVIVEMQDFDDYNQNRFIVDPDSGEPLKFYSYRAASNWLNSRIKSEYIHHDHLVADAKTYQYFLFK